MHRESSKDENGILYTWRLTIVGAPICSTPVQKQLREENDKKARHTSGWRRNLLFLSLLRLPCGAHQVAEMPKTIDMCDRDTAARRQYDGMVGVLLVRN